MAALVGVVIGNPEGAELIRGGQGRYLIPLAPFFFLLLYRPAAGTGSRRWIASVCVYSAAAVDR